MSDGQLWSVRLADGRTIQCTLDQLDTGFESGHVDAQALVLAPGSTQWARLGDLAGIDAAPPAAASCTPGPVYASVPPSVPASLRPVSADIDFDVGPAAYPGASSKKWVVGAALGAAAVVGILVFVITSGGSSSASTTSAAAAAPPPPATTTEAAPTPPPPPATTEAPRLNDDQRKALADLDKQNDRKAAAKAKNRPLSVGGGHHSSKPIKSQGFTTGGNKYDPLNVSM
jgi:hypothetical protein